MKRTELERGVHCNWELHGTAVIDAPTSFTGSNHESTTLRRFCDSCQTRAGVMIKIKAIGRISKIVSSNSSEKSNPPRQEPASKLRELSRSRHEGRDVEETMATLCRPSRCIGRLAKKRERESRGTPRVEWELKRDRRVHALEESERTGGRSRIGLIYRGLHPSAQES